MQGYARGLQLGAELQRKAVASATQIMRDKAVVEFNLWLLTVSATSHFSVIQALGYTLMRPQQGHKDRSVQQIFHGLGADACLPCTNIDSQCQLIPTGLDASTTRLHHVCS